MNIAFPQDFTLDDLDAIRIVKEHKPNCVAVRLGLICTFYLKDPHNIEVRRRLAQCGDEYQALFGDYLKLYRNPDGEGRSKKYPKGGVPLVKYLALHPSAEKAFAPDFTGGESIDDASAYSLEIFASSTVYSPKGNKPAQFAATLPFGWLKDKDGQKAFQHLVHGWCQILKPHHGYAGLGIIQGVEMMEKIRTSYLAYPLAKRFPGLEIDNPSIVAMHIGDGIKGVNWLTAVDEGCLTRLGGRAAVLAQLDENFPLYEYEGGVLIQAGPTPQLGDVNRQHFPRYYQHLARILAPLRMRFPAGHPMIQPANGEDSTEASNQWLARFD